MKKYIENIDSIKPGDVGIDRDTAAVYFIVEIYVDRVKIKFKGQDGTYNYSIEAFIGDEIIEGAE